MFSRQLKYSEKIASVEVKTEKNNNDKRSNCQLLKMLARIKVVAHSTKIS